MQNTVGWIHPFPPGSIYILHIYIYCIYKYIYIYLYIFAWPTGYRRVHFFLSHSMGLGGARHIFGWGKIKVEMLVSTPFFQGFSICILGRCSLQEMANYLIIFTFFDGVRGPSIAEIHHCGLYARESWPAGSNRLIFFRGQRGVGGLPVQKKLRRSAEWFIFDQFFEHCYSKRWYIYAWPTVLWVKVTKNLL